jgi:membrane protein
MRISDLPRLVKESVSAWVDDHAPSMGAALSYYTVFSLAPLLLIVIGIAGLVFGADVARDAIVAQLQSFLGPDGASAVKGLLESASQPQKSILASIVGFLTLMLGATSVLGELQSDLDRIFEAPEPVKGGVWGLIRSRLLSFGLIIAIGFLLLVSLVISTALAAVGSWWGAAFGNWTVVLEALNTAVSFAVVTALFTMIYKILPRVKLAWHDVWIGAAITAALFTVGKFAIGLYLGKSGITTGFGAAASFVVILVWVYYSAQIFLFGAEFTWVYAREFGSLQGTVQRGAAARPAAPDRQNAAVPPIRSAPAVATAAVVPSPRRETAFGMMAGLILGIILRVRGRAKS